MLRVKGPISTVYKSGQAVRLWRSSLSERFYSQAAQAAAGGAQQPPPAEGSSQTPPPPPPKKGGVFGKLFALTVLGAGGVVGYAWYDADFRKQVETNVPYSKEALDAMFQYLPEKPGTAKPVKSQTPAQIGDGPTPIVTDVEAVKTQGLAKPTVIKEDKSKEEPVQKAKSAEVLRKEKAARELEEKKQKEKQKIIQSLKDKEREDAAQNAAVVKILSDLQGMADEMTTMAVQSQQAAADALKQHTEELRRAMDMQQVSGGDTEWKAVTEAHQARRDALESAETTAQTARREQEKLRAAIKDGRMSNVTSKNPHLVEAEKALSAITYKLNKSTDQLKKAQSEAKVMAEYRDVVKKGREQFKKELESVQPEIKIGNRVGGKMTEEELNSLIAHAHRRIEQLQRRVAEQQTMEQQRIEAALLRQAHEDEKVADGRVRSEEQRLRDEFSIEKTRWDTEARVQFEHELRQQLARQAAAHSDHLSDVLNVQERELQVKFDGLLSDRIMAERDNFQTEVAGWIARLKGIEAAVEGRAELEKQGRKAQELWLACQTLEAVVSGEGETSTKPLKPEMEAIRQAGNNHPFVNTVIDSLPAASVEHGLQTEEALVERFTTVRRVCRRVAMIDETGGTLMRYLLSYLQSWFVFTSAKAISEQQDLEEKDLNTFVLVDNATYCLERGDLAQAVRFMNQLKGEPRRVAHDWLQDARLLLETKQAADALLAHASASGLGSLF